MISLSRDHLNSGQRGETMAFAQDGLQYQAILITGGFGAIGKVVVQKLLAHSAPFPRRIGSDFPGRQSA